MRTLCAILACVFGGSVFAQSSTTLYKSTGPDGWTIYSDRPSVDSRGAKTLTFQNAPASALSPETQAYIEQLRKSADVRAAELAPPSSQTTLYTAAWCGYCKKAKAYLAAKRIPYREFDIDTKDGVAAFAVASKGKTGVPLLIAGGQSLVGFSAESYDALLGARR